VLHEYYNIPKVYEFGTRHISVLDLSCQARPIGSPSVSNRANSFLRKYDALLLNLKAGTFRGLVTIDQRPRLSGTGNARLSAWRRFYSGLEFGDSSGHESPTSTAMFITPPSPPKSTTSAPPWRCRSERARAAFGRSRRREKRSDAGNQESRGPSVPWVASPRSQLCVRDLIVLGRAGPDRNIVFDDRRHRVPSDRSHQRGDLRKFTIPGAFRTDFFKRLARGPRFVLSRCPFTSRDSGSQRSLRRSLFSSADRRRTSKRAYEANSLS
jgi:hypothetical protein